MQKLEIDGRISLEIQPNRLKFGNSFLLNAKADFTVYPIWNEPLFTPNINDLHSKETICRIFVAGLTKKPFGCQKS
jgi:hypothetical protein